MNRGIGNGTEDQTEETELQALLVFVAGSRRSRRCSAGCAVTGISIFAYFYHKYEGIVDERLKQPIFASTAQIYAAPREVRPDKKLSIHWIANELHEAGYTDEGAVAGLSTGNHYSEGAQQNYCAARPASPIMRRIAPQSM